MSSAVNSITGIASGILGMQQGNKQIGFAERGLAESDPWGPFRHQYGMQLQSLLAHPENITKMPGYKFGLNQGTEAIDRSMAAKEMLHSGNQEVALDKFGQDYAQNFFMQQEQMLAGLAGVNMQPQLGAAVAGYSGGVQTYGEGLGSIQYGMGQAANVGSFSDILGTIAGGGSSGGIPMGYHGA